MTLSFYANGAGGFQCRTQGVDVGALFSAADIAGLMEHVRNPVRFARGVAENEAITSNLERAGTRLADGNFQHVFRGSVIGLMTEPKPLVMNLAFRNTHVFSGDEIGRVHVFLSRDLDNPTWHLMSVIRPVLERVHMNNSGVLLGLAEIFNRYMAHSALPGASPDHVAQRPTTFEGPRRLNISVAG